MDGIAIEAGTYTTDKALGNGTATVTVHVPVDWTVGRMAAAVRPIAEILSRRKK